MSGSMAPSESSLASSDPSSYTCRKPAETTADPVARKVLPAPAERSTPMTSSVAWIIWLATARLQTSSYRAS